MKTIDDCTVNEWNYLEPLRDFQAEDYWQQNASEREDHQISADAASNYATSEETWRLHQLSDAMNS